LIKRIKEAVYEFNTKENDKTKTIKSILKPKRTNSALKNFLKKGGRKNG